MKVYEFSNKGLTQAVADRHTTLRIRRTLISISIIVLVGIVSPHTASVVAFRVL